MRELGWPPNYLPTSFKDKPIWQDSEKPFKVSLNSVKEYFFNEIGEQGTTKIVLMKFVKMNYKIR